MASAFAGAAARGADAEGAAQAATEAAESSQTRAHPDVPALILAMRT